MNCGVCNHREVCRCFPNPEEYCSDYEPERPHGEWIEHRTQDIFGYFHSEYECSNCHDDVFQKTEWQFCPNCGASMISSNSKIEKSKSAICPCIECCEIDNSEPCRKGCSEYKKWKEGGAE